ncbi:MAG: hypothetical protein HKL85_06330 [Acidimicrobiaceae bacterium]|nr:hypothetical protein [Acidimicrobiaceae bacterium]
MMKKILAATTTLCLVGSLTAIASASAATPTSLNGLTGAQIEAVALAQMRAAGSYTMTVTSAISGFTGTSTTSSTLTSGIRHDVVNGQRGEKIFVNGVVYVNLTTALEKIYFGKVIPAFSNKWISFTRGQPYYSLFSTTMAESTLAPILKFRGALTVSPPLTYDAQRVVGISSAASSSTAASGVLETLYVADTPPFLPVALVITAHSSPAAKPIETIVFKDWGARVKVTAPRHFTSSSKFKLP